MTKRTIQFCFCVQFAALLIAAAKPNIEVTLTRIGETPVASAAPPIPVHRFDTVAGRISEGALTGAHIYWLTRRTGDHWRVGGGTDAPPNGPSLFELGPEFGGQIDDLELFDLRIMVDRDRLATGPVPDRVLNSPRVLGMSRIYRIQRVSLNKPVIGITRINGMDVWEDSVPWVPDESSIDIISSRLRIGARIGVAIRPTRPLNESLWIQADELEDGGSLNAHWGEHGLNSFVRYTATAFAVASEKDFPPRGVPIPVSQWPEYTAKFLAESKPVTVVKEADYFTIETVNNRRVPGGVRVSAEPQVDVTGLLDRPIEAGETVWLICIPEAGKPWVATPSRDSSDNVWHAKAVQLWRRGQPTELQLVAVLSKDDATKFEPEQLRPWVNTSKHSVNTVRLHVALGDKWERTSR